MLYLLSYHSKLLSYIFRVNRSDSILVLFVETLLNDFCVIIF